MARAWRGVRWAALRGELREQGVHRPPTCASPGCVRSPHADWSTGTSEDSHARPSRSCLDAYIGVCLSICLSESGVRWTKSPGGGELKGPDLRTLWMSLGRPVVGDCEQAGIRPRRTVVLIRRREARRGRGELKGQGAGVSPGEKKSTECWPGQALRESLRRSTALTG
jgi:hypothetical protein